MAKDKVETPQEEVWVKPKNKGGRPRVKVPKSGVTRETRVPIDGARDVLTVVGKDPNYFYYWELDSDENGNRIHKRRMAGYEFVQSGTVKVGQASVYKSHEHGSLIRHPSGGDYLYLMRIPMQWHLDDIAALERKNKELEQSVEVTADSVGGKYGSIKISRK